MTLLDICATITHRKRISTNQSCGKAFYPIFIIHELDVLFHKTSVKLRSPINKTPFTMTPCNLPPSTSPADTNAFFFQKDCLHIS